MIRSHRFAWLSAALVAGMAVTILVAGVALAMPDTAVELPDDTTILAGWILLLIGVTVVGERLGPDHR